MTRRAGCLHATCCYPSCGCHVPIPTGGDIAPPLVAWLQAWWTRGEAWRKGQRAQLGPDVAHLMRGVADMIEDLAPAPSPLGGLADVIAEYDRIVDRLDRPDPEADFVMRGSDWRVIREALGREALGADTARLDWLQQIKDADFGAVNGHAHSISKVSLFTVASQRVIGDSVRDAIDLAMKVAP